MAKTLQELLARRSPESQARIQKMADELLINSDINFSENYSLVLCTITVNPFYLQMLLYPEKFISTQVHFHIQLSNIRYT